MEPEASHLHRGQQSAHHGGCCNPEWSHPGKEVLGTRRALDATRVTKTTASLLASKRTRQAQRATIRDAFSGGGKQITQVAC